MLIVSEIIENSILKRTISCEDVRYLEEICATVLIAYEYKWMKKMQVNIYASGNSTHIEYADTEISIYTRENSIHRNGYLMIVSFIPSSGNAHTSTVFSSSILGCFNEYLTLSDQRQSYIHRVNNTLIRLEQLPPTHLDQSNGVIETKEIKFKSV